MILLKSYLDNRNQITYINIIHSNIKHNNIGLPLVSGPLLFIIYISNSPEIVNNDLNKVAYDLLTSLTVSSDNVDTLNKNYTYINKINLLV